MKKFKRIIALVLAAAFAFACITACGSSNKTTTAAAASGETAAAGDATTAAAASDLPSYNFNLGTMFYDPATSTNFNSDGEYAAKFKELVEEKSGGRVTVTIHWASVLGGTADLVDQLRSGTLDLMAGSVYTANDKRFGVFYIPYLFDNLDTLKYMFTGDDAPLGKILSQLYEENQIEVLSLTCGQLRGIFNNIREVHVPSDVDFVFRTYSDDVVTKFWGGLTKNTTNIAISELYTALQLGTCDGFEFNPCAMIANGYTDVIDYYSDIDWQFLSNANLTMSKQVYDTVDAETQALLKECALEAAEYYNTIIDQYNVDAIDYMTENDVAVYNITDEERAEWEAYGKSLWPEFREMFGEDLFDEVTAIVEDYYAERDAK